MARICCGSEQSFCTEHRHRSSHQPSFEAISLMDVAAMMESRRRAEYFSEAEQRFRWELVKANLLTTYSL